jgi:hypothetical protein
MTSKESPRRLHDHGNRILIAGFALTILYFGRSVLIPLALMLSLLVAPLVRAYNVGIINLLLSILMIESIRKGRAPQMPPSEQCVLLAALDQTFVSRPG